jgi:hypothetical protein
VTTYEPTWEDVQRALQAKDRTEPLGPPVQPEEVDAVQERPAAQVPVREEAGRSPKVRPARQEEVVPRFKTGEPRTKKNGHEVGCTCRPCLGARSRRKGLSKQRAARKALGVPPTRNRSQSSNEENWRHEFRVECKAGQQVNAIATRFLLAEKQADQNKAEGDPRRMMMVAMPDGWGNEGLIVMRLSTWREREQSLER